jgi:hypothetical protein
MQTHRKMWGALCLLVAYAVLVTPARGDLSGDFANFQSCPRTNPEVERCFHAVSKGGKVVLGSRSVPIEKPVLIQGGITKVIPGTKFSRLVSPSTGVTMAKVAQNVPGGLLGIVPKSSSTDMVQALAAAFFENDLLGLQVTLELAKPAEEVEINPSNLSPFASGVVLRLPVKVHLENPILGPDCYVGSAKHPIVWNLGPSQTSPPAPNKPIEGTFGKSSFVGEGLAFKVTGNKMVDNAWGAPPATGCGGPLAFLINPMVNDGLGTTAAGHNTTLLENDLELVTTAGLKFAEEEGL